MWRHRPNAPIHHRAIRTANRHVGQTITVEVAGGREHGSRWGCVGLRDGQDLARRVEYVELVAADTLEPVETLDAAAVLLVAAWFGDVRLIDNVELGG